MRRESQLTPVILAGGEGRRLAPITSPDRAKPFIPLPDGRSLLTKTCERVNAPGIFAPPVIVGQESARFSLLNHARDAGVTPQPILLEPKVNNTAMAVAVAAAYALQTNPDAVLAILPADHAIEPAERWRDTVARAAEASVTAQKICLLAVKPEHPSPEYGYMALKNEGLWYRVERFIEKPKEPEMLLAANGGALRWAWNAGQFVAPARVFAEAFAVQAAAIWLAAQNAVVRARSEWEFTLLDAGAYIGLEPISFDRAVLEKIPSIACTLETSWRDLGTIAAWESYTGMLAAAFTQSPLRNDRPWGYFELIARDAHRVEKQLVIYPGCRLSRQCHRLRSEQWEIIGGIAHIELDDEQIILQAGDTITISPYRWHRLANKEEKLLIINEVQWGAPDENDIERSDDDYGRLKYLITVL